MAWSDWREEHQDIQRGRSNVRKVRIRWKVKLANSREWSWHLFRLLVETRYAQHLFQGGGNSERERACFYEQRKNLSKFIGRHWESGPMENKNWISNYKAARIARCLANFFSFSLFFHSLFSHRERILSFRETFYLFLRFVSRTRSIKNFNSSNLYTFRLIRSIINRNRDDRFIRKFL